jgi:hypothetical protein
MFDKAAERAVIACRWNDPQGERNENADRSETLLR